MSLVESIPEYVKFDANVTLGIPLEQTWKHLISLATKQVHVVSFYWTLTGEDINVNSSSDAPVSYQMKDVYVIVKTFLWIFVGKDAFNKVSLSSAGEGNPQRTRRAALQECVCPSGDQRTHHQDKLN